MLDLAIEHGLFSRAVVALRARWGIDARVSLPTEAPLRIHGMGECVAYLPSVWPDQLPISPLLPSLWESEDDVDLGEALSGIGPVPVTDLVCQIEWWQDLQRLHDLFIPAAARDRRPLPAAAWTPFLSACVLYEPPRDGLLDFVNAPPVSFDLPPVVPPDSPPNPADVSAWPGMALAPLTILRDADEAEHAMMAFYEDVMRVMAGELAELGIDLREVRNAVIRQHPELSERYRERLRRIPVHHVITPSEHTTQEDVINAFKLFTARQRRDARPAKPTRAALTCVQCAVWYDEFGWSQEQIGRRFGWKIQHPPAQKARCETARQHIREGRRILKHE